MKKYRKIGIYDSGIGGLPVANLVLQRYPFVDLVYLADNAHFPLGDKSETDILDILKKGIDILSAQQCDDIVIACNTASIVFERWQSEFNQNSILPVTRPLLNLIRESTAKKAVLYGTTFTVESGYYQHWIRQLAPSMLLQAVDHQDWVQMVECSFQLEDHPIHGNGLNKDTELLILACTHFHHLMPEIISTNTYEKQLIDSADCIAYSVADYLSTSLPEQKVDVSGITGERHFLYTANLPVSSFARPYRWEYIGDLPPDIRVMGKR